MSKFSKVSLFSGLNNLIDITLEPAYSAVCGYTDHDLDTVFAPELAGLDRDAIRDWYNGYRWLGEEVYNPFDILLHFRRREFGAYWFETGTPKFLVETLFRRRVSSVELNRMAGSGDLLSAFDVDDMATEALLFQTGYLTITGEVDLEGEPLYQLGYPNREVRQSLNRSLLRYLVKDPTRQAANSVRLHELLRTRDFDGLKTLFQAFFSSIPHEWYTNNDIANYEGYYASVFYSYFAALGLGRGRRGEQRSRTPRHGGAPGRDRLPVRVQGRGDGPEGRGAGPDQGKGLRGQIPGRKRRGLLGGGGVQQGHAERGGVRGGDTMIGRETHACCSCATWGGR